MFDSLFRNMTPVVKNLLIINVLVFIAQLGLPVVNESLALYPFQSEMFRPWQLVTHFFMHSTSGFFHILFNMYAVVIFGAVLEKVWGPQRFLFFYFATALGAALLHNLVGYIRINSLLESLDPVLAEEVLNEGSGVIAMGKNYTHATMGEVNMMLNTPTVGASGAVFGLLAAFAYLFPNTELYLMFIPMPIKAKWLVIGYALIELWLGFSNNPSDNVAHFAHLGGALVGIIIVLIWRKDKTTFY